MTTESAQTWGTRVAACSAEASDMEPEALLGRIDALAAERPAGDPNAAYVANVEELLENHS